MQLDLRYFGESHLARIGDGLSLSFAPNLARPATFFDAEVQSPVRFREAISALHDVVISDLRRPPKDRTAWRKWKADEEQRERELRAQIADEARRAQAAKAGKREAPPNLKSDFQRMHRLYWGARVRWAGELMRSDPELFRHLVPCDPVVTVAPDVVFFECFSKDESSYACLSADRGAFSHAGDAALGTTNVDYSMSLYDHFQELRTYRPTRLLVDPAGFSVDVAGSGALREEKIDLPPSWLRGFGQLSAAMALPSRKIELSVDVVYSLLALLVRRKDAKGGRALEFHLTPGEPPAVVVQPWGVRLQSSGAPYEAYSFGDTTAAEPSAGGAYRSAPARAVTKTEVIKVWGRRRLMALARLLPLVTHVEVRLLGSGLPSVWIARAGDMRLVLALSGWTANDWAGGANLDALAGDLMTDDALTERVAAELDQRRSATFGELTALQGAPNAAVLGSLFTLSKRGQVIFDYATDRFRYRPILPVPLADALVGDGVEPREGKALAQGKAVKILTQTAIGPSRVHVTARVKDTSCEAVFDDQGLSRAKCTCSFFHKMGMKGGPCRHLLALRLTFTGKDAPAFTARAAPPPVAGGAKEDVFTFAKPIADRLEAASRAARRDARSLLEEAWDLASPRIQAAKSWGAAAALAKDGPALVGGGDVAAPSVALSPAFHPALLAEIGKVAAHHGVSPSAVLNLAWLLHEPAQRKGGASNR